MMKKFKNLDKKKIKKLYPELYVKLKKKPLDQVVKK